MTAPVSLDALVELIRGYCAAEGIQPAELGRDRFFAAHKGRVGTVDEFRALWTLAKGMAGVPKDERPEPEPEASSARLDSNQHFHHGGVLHPRPRAPSPAQHGDDQAPCLRSERSTPVRGSRIPKMLVIPDAHAHPQYSNERFAWLGALIAEERPDVIVCLGDFADMPALSGYDKGKRGFEGRRYTRDVDSTREALALMHAGITHGPELITCLGNHESRIDRATSDCAELEGAITTRDLGFEEYGWRVIPYMASVTVGGFAISHHFASGVAGRPIGGMTMAASMARLLFTSAIVGHSHTLDWARRTRPDGSRVVTLVPGCYTAVEQGEESWCKATSHLWWRGVAILEDVAGGDFGALRLISQDSMRERYGRAPLPSTEVRARMPRWERP